MFTLSIAIARTEVPGVFEVRCGNVANEDGDIVKTCHSPSEVKEAVGDIAQAAIEAFEAEEAKRAKAHEEHEQMLHDKVAVGTDPQANEDVDTAEDKAE